ncbi:MAG: N-acetylmuramoyl-L-alanine amidase [Rhizobiaceae bacterium]|nr:N-acetylmuramoyl-L-alanine amidase [Rhizobiaceae bacterium]
MEFVGTPHAKLILLRNPNRIAIDLFDTVSALDALDPQPNDFVSDMRQGLVAADRYRIIFTLARPGLPQADIATTEEGSVLTLKIVASDIGAFLAADPSRTIGAAPEPAVPSSAATVPDRSYTVVVDPGHGGVDNGAVGKQGTLEKEVNLAFAKALRDALGKNDHIEVRLTREDDRFVSLSDRSDIAREAKADIFISMHADSIRYPDIRGATVYTLSERASDQLSREIAESENSADRFVDPEWEKGEPEVFDILIELMRRETDSFSQHFAAGLVQELGRHKIRLIRNPQRAAGFKVLTAPDVPSVLVELGYLSNVDDEELLLDESWREDTANAIADAVVGFLSAGASGDKAATAPIPTTGG